jgi:hypothetical protein
MVVVGIFGARFSCRFCDERLLDPDIPKVTRAFGFDLSGPSEAFLLKS